LLEPPAVAEIVALSVDVTLKVETAKTPVVFPAAIVMDFGTVAADRLLESITTSPAVGAGPLMVTVPVEDFPPVTVVGLSFSEVSAGALMARIPVAEAVPTDATIEALTELTTGVVLTEKVAEVLPAPMLTVAGTIAAA